MLSETNHTDQGENNPFLKLNLDSRKIAKKTIFSCSVLFRQGMKGILSYLVP